jgi:drug/metabolite transporter (DMT)-like permease
MASASRSSTNSLAGPAWVLVASLGFASAWTLIRLASAELHPFTLVFWRNLSGLILLAPVLVRDRSLLNRAEWRTHAMRSTSGVVAMFGTFYAVSNAPLATVQAINFAAPIIATTGAALFLGERIRARRVGALMVGFAGVLIVLRPGALPVTSGIVAAVVAAVATAFSLLAIKHLVGVARPMAVVAWSYVLPLVPTGIVAAFVWSWPHGVEWLYLFGIGASTLVGQIATTRAFRLAEATAVMPYDFVRFGLMVAAGVWLFGEKVEPATLVGGAAILGSSIYLAYREAVLARRGPASAPNLP